MYEQNGYHFLEVADVREEDKGHITCVASNSQGSVNVQAELQVFGKYSLLIGDRRATGV